MKRKRKSPADPAKVRQLRIIWGLARDLGITDEDLYLLLFSVSGKDSLSLEGPEGKASRDKLIRELTILKAKRESSPAAGEKVVGLHQYRSSRSQQEKARELADKINGDRPKVSLEKLSQRMYGKEFERLNRKQTQGVIEALKNILARAGGGN